LEQFAVHDQRQHCTRQEKPAETSFTEVNTFLAKAKLAAVNLSDLNRHHHCLPFDGGRLTNFPSRPLEFRRVVTTFVHSSTVYGLLGLACFFHGFFF